MRRIPGIVLADGPLGREARLAGTGLAVYEVVKAHRLMGEAWGRLREAFHWLSAQQLRAALAYAAAYPEEIDALLRDEDASTAEAIWSAYPFTRPPWR